MSIAAGSLDEKSLEHVKTGRAGAAVRGAFWSVVSSFAPAAFGMLVFLATSRVLTPAEFGLVAFAASIATLGTAIAPAGFGEALVQRANIDHRHLDTVFWLCVGTALVIYAVLVVAAFPVSAQMGQPVLLALIPFIGARVIFDMAAAVPNSLLIRSMSFKKLAIRTGAASLVAAASCLLLLWLGFGLWALAFSQLASAIVLCVGAMITARWIPGFSFDMDALRDLRSFGIFASGNRLITMLSVDQVLIGALLGPAGLGIYSFARRIFQILSDLITGALGSVSYSLLSSMQHEHDKMREAYLFATFVSSVISFPVFVGLALVADDLVPFAFGQNWTGAITTVQVFCGLGLITSIGVLQSSLVKSQGQADMWFYYLVAKQIATILYVLLFHSWGVDALALAIVILNYLMWIPSVHMVVRILRVSPAAYLASFVLPIIATAFMVGVGYEVKDMMSESEPLLRLALTIGTSALAYCLFLAVFARRRLGQVVAAVAKRGR